MITKKIEGHHRGGNEKSRNQHPWVVLDILRIHRLRKQIAPTRGGLLDSQAQQRERAFAKNVARNRERSVDRREPEHRGNHVTAENPDARATKRAARLDERRRAYRSR